MSFGAIMENVRGQRRKEKASLGRHGVMVLDAYSYTRTRKLYCDCYTTRMSV